MLSRIADRLILSPTRDPIDPGDRTLRTIETSQGQVEAWIFSHCPNRRKAGDHPDVIGIKFPGTGGRAERGGPHPFELWPGCISEVWTVNHTGYGGSEGAATLQTITDTCAAVHDRVTKAHPSVPIVLIGNSLGCVSALYLASRVNAAGVYLRNPVPLHQMISQRPRYNWWNFGMAKLIANQVPAELDAVQNARLTTCPAFFVRSEKDRVIPAAYQKMIFDAFAGEKEEFVLKGADHHHSVPDVQADSYIERITALESRWLG